MPAYSRRVEHVECPARSIWSASSPREASTTWKPIPAEEAKRPADGRFIVDQKNANGSLRHQETLLRAVAGMAAKNVVPSVSSL